MSDDQRIEAAARALYEYFRPIWKDRDNFDAKPWDVSEEGDEPGREMWRGAARAILAAIP
jgi:hypothetical protein